jgi:hypothetical protein
MAGHTEGPWRYYAGSHSIWQQVGGTDGRCICIVTGPRKTLDPERLANARLIAAAPTMREYIAKRAAQGDAEALQILEAIDANS